VSLTELLTPDAVAFLGIFLGVLFRTLAPAIRKWREAESRGEIFAVSQKYTATAVTSFLIAFITTMLGMQAFQIPSDGLSLFKLFQAAFLYGLGLNALLNEVATWF